MKEIFRLLVATVFLLLSPLEAKKLKSFKNSVSMKFVKIPSGSYMMGTSLPTKKCPKDNPFTKEDEYVICLKEVKKMANSISKDEKPSHKVTIQSFYMQTTEVTQKQWYAVMGNNPSYFKNGDPNMPIENVSYEDVMLFIKKLNEKEHTNKYRLPTEEEWEYAARAGSTTKWFFGNKASKLGKYAWYAKNSKESPHPVAKKKPNKWGLYDIHGNVMEWTSSGYSEDYSSQRRQTAKMVRGGSFNFLENGTRSAFRFSGAVDDRIKFIGFRLSATK